MRGRNFSEILKNFNFDIKSFGLNKVLLILKSQKQKSTTTAKCLKLVVR